MWAQRVRTSAAHPILSQVAGELHIKQLQSFQPSLLLGLETGVLFCFVFFTVADKA